MQDQDCINAAIRVLKEEAQGILDLVPHVGEEFARACRLILGCRGKVILTGVGKSGHIATKIASSLASTGTQSFFVESAEAAHGDLGMIGHGDVVIAVSNSGETPEVVSACRIAKSVGAQIGLLTQRNQTELTQIADSVLYAGDIHQTGDRLFINSQMPLMFLIDAVSYRLLENDTCRENRDHALQILFHRES